LAETLFNLQHVSGLQSRIDQLPGKDLEASVAEFDSARLLFMNSIPIRFVEEIGKTGSDYDLCVDINGMSVACETKCKIEGTELSVSAIKSRLKDARSQLPSDRPGIVFVHIPEAWVRNELINEVAPQALNETFRGTRRISTVILFWEEWELSGEAAMRTVRFRTEHNPYARLPLTAYGKILRPMPTESPWQSLAVLVN
jgi:hypothetical protein